MKVLLLAGGMSNEAAVSQRSGDNVAEALAKLGYDVVRANPADTDFDIAGAASGCDVVFSALHGAGGEDGVIQGQLEKLGVPFVGSGAAASRLSFDKLAFKRLLDERKIPTPRWQEITPQQFASSELARQPFVLKPIEGGSSIDTFIVRDPANPPENLQPTLQKYGSMLLEELIEGDELTVGVLGDQALPVILIIPPEGAEFDYENKYNGQSQEIVAPDSVSAEIQQHAQELALQVHQATGCRHMSRTDIMVGPDGRQFVLEINTIPGLTTESLFPKAAAAAGFTMPQLIDRLIKLAVA